MIGSGLSVGNALELIEKADGAIVGTSLKENGAGGAGSQWTGSAPWSGKLVSCGFSPVLLIRPRRRPSRFHWLE